VFICGETDAIVPCTIVPFNSLERLSSYVGLKPTSLELNGDGFIGALHEKSSMPVSQAHLIVAFEFMFSARYACLSRVLAYLTSFMIVVVCAVAQSRSRNKVLSRQAEARLSSTRVILQKKVVFRSMVVLAQVKSNV
jgi:hypothetical protein